MKSHHDDVRTRLQLDRNAVLIGQERLRLIARLNQLAVEPERIGPLASHCNIRGTRVPERQRPRDKHKTIDRLSIKVRFTSADHTQICDITPGRLHRPQHIGTLCKWLPKRRLKRCWVDRCGSSSIDWTCDQPLPLEALRSSRPQLSQWRFDRVAALSSVNVVASQGADRCECDKQRGS